MYAVGNLPDHVTRYNHKNQNRWMIQRVRVERPRANDVLSTVAMVLCVPALIVSAVMILQGVGL